MRTNASGPRKQRCFLEENYVNYWNMRMFCIFLIFGLLLFINLLRPHDINVDWHPARIQP